MSGDTLADKIIALLEPLAPANGLELVAVEVVGGRRQPTVRVYLDREGGIDIEAIAIANRWVSEALDEADLIQSAYTLEVSSPGLDRPLRKRSDYERFLGQTARVQLAKPVEGRGAFTGVMKAVEDDDLVLDVDGSEIRLPLRDIAKARLKAEIDFNRIERGEV